LRDGSREPDRDALPESLVRGQGST
jgi:hypothetical protein